MSVMKLSCKFVYKTAQCVSTYQKDLIPFMSKASNFRVCPTILQRLCSNLLSSHGQNFTRHQHFRCLTLTPLTFFFAASALFNIIPSTEVPKLIQYPSLHCPITCCLAATSTLKGNHEMGGGFRRFFLSQHILGTLFVTRIEWTSEVAKRNKRPQTIHDNEWSTYVYCWAHGSPTGWIES